MRVYVCRSVTMFIQRFPIALQLTFHEGVEFHSCEVHPHTVIHIRQVFGTCNNSVVLMSPLSDVVCHVLYIVGVSLQKVLVLLNIV